MAKRKTKKATSGQPSKSAAIVEQVKQNSAAANAEVAEAVNAQYGWEISPGYVSTIKSQKGLTKGRKGKAKKTVARKTAGKTVKRAGRPKAAANSDLSLAQLQDAKRLADELGGVEQAKKALDALAGLRG